MKVRHNYGLQVLSCRAIAVVSQYTFLVILYWGSAPPASSGKKEMIQRAAKMIKARVGFMRKD